MSTEKEFETAMNQPQISNAVDVFTEGLIEQYKELQLDITDKDIEYMKSEFHSALKKAHRSILSDEDFVYMNELFSHEKYGPLIKKIWSKELSIEIGNTTAIAASNIIQYMAEEHKEEIMKKSSERLKDQYGQ